VTTVSVFTPSHKSTHLDSCYRSLAAQTHGDWEWVVLLNGKLRSWAPPEPDERVRVIVSQTRSKAIGALKREAVEATGGELLVELDHDDVVASDCLAEVVAAFAQHPEAALVYSDFAQIDEHGAPEHTRFDEASGWVYDQRFVDKTEHLVCNALEPSPHNVGLIWYAPNHVRAFRRSTYDQVGGYDAALEVLDDQDLMIRLYLAGEFVRIPRCLYLQRWHPSNTQRDPKTNQVIQEETVRIYLEAIEPLTLAWSARRSLGSLSLTTATSIGSTVMSQHPQVATVLLDPAVPSLPFADSSIGVIEAYDILQRVPDRAAFLNECHRVLAHGGHLLTMSPSTDGRGAFQDPSHVAFYNENSFAYLTEARLRPTIPTLTSRWQIGRLLTTFPSDYHRERDIPYVRADLLAIKQGSRQGGPLLA
jgi:hypothetical protein